MFALNVDLILTCRYLCLNNLSSVNFYLKIGTHLIIWLRFNEEVADEANDCQDHGDEEGGEGQEVGQALIEVDMDVTVEIEALSD